MKKEMLLRLKSWKIYVHILADIFFSFCENENEIGTIYDINMDLFNCKKIYISSFNLYLLLIHLYNK